jgi:hypothetical protein
MVLLGHSSNELWNLDYDKIFLQKIQFLPITFNGDVMFKLLPIFSTIHRPSQMQGMDRKYNGHAWCKVITTNIKNKFGFNFRKVHCLGHLHCVQDDCEHFVCSTSRNETLWCGECTHIPVVGQMAMFPSASPLECKLCHALPLCVTNCREQIYYVVHRL